MNMHEYTRHNTTICPICKCLIPDTFLSEHNKIMHAARDPRGAVEIPVGARVHTNPQWGIEFEDEPADKDMYDSLNEMRVVYQEDVEAEDQSGMEGMRMMTRSVTTIVGPWVPVEGS